MEVRPFQGQAVIITGASSGLGAALAHRFARMGADTTLFARSSETLETVAETCRAFGTKSLVVCGDVTVDADCARLVEEAIRYFARLDHLVACAGIGMWARFDELSEPSILQRIMDVNYGGVINPVFHALPHLKTSEGSLVAISSVQAKFGVPYHTGYAASKHAVQGFCDSLRLELRGSGVNVLSILAHWIQGTRLRENALNAEGRRRGAEAHRHRGGAIPVEALAGLVTQAMCQRRRNLFVPRWMRLLALLAEVAPGTADYLISRRVEREATKSVH